MTNNTHETNEKRKAAGEVYHRSFTLRDGVRKMDADKRTVELAFASSEPVETMFGPEILDHSRGSVRLSRMQSGAAVLVNHDADQHVGVVESVSVASDEGVSRAVVRFGRSAFAEEIFQDIVDGIRSLVSVGFRIHDLEEMKLPDGGFGVRVTDWEPFEISIVAVPADASVGVGRTLKHTGEKRDEETTMKRETVDAPEGREESAESTEGQAPGADQQRAESVVEERTEDAPSRARVKVDGQIRELGKKFKLSNMAEELIALNGSLDDMERAVRNSIINRNPEPVRSSREIQFQGGAPRYKKLRAFKDMGEEAAFRSGMWARAHLFGDDKAANWCRDHHMRVMTTTAISKGGALVPEELSQAIIDLRENYGILRSLARVVPMNTETLSVPRRVGGVTAYFVGQEDATTASDKSWDSVQLVARELSALTRFSQAYAEDAVIDVAEDLANEMAYAFAEKEDDCAINGDGTSTYGGIMGMRTLLIDANHTAGILTADSGVDTYAELDSTDLANLRAKLPAYAEAGARWLWSKAGKNTVIDPILAAAGGNTKMDLGGRLVDAYLGDPIMVSQKMPTSTGDLSDVVMALYGNFEQACTVGDRRGFSLQVLTERYAEFRQIGVIATERFDFVAHDLGDTSNAGPVVGLVGE